MFIGVTIITSRVLFVSHLQRKCARGTTRTPDGSIFVLLTPDLGLAFVAFFNAFLLMTFEKRRGDIDRRVSSPLSSVVGEAERDDDVAASPQHS
jgi:hypothetical protein